jgi:hypothetical protein
MYKAVLITFGVTTLLWFIIFAIMVNYNRVVVREVMKGSNDYARIAFSELARDASEI